MASEPAAVRPRRTGVDPSGVHIAGLDLVRGIAAFAVAIPHFISNEDPASPVAEQIAVVSVEVFFLLSGFVLAPQLLYVIEAICASERLRRLRIFLLRRWMRTLPPYLVALVIIATLTGNLFSAEFFKLLVFSQNLFSVSANNEFFVPAWSLSVEEWFYIVFPIFLLACRGCSLSAVTGSAIFLGLFLTIKLAMVDLVPNAGLVARRLVIFRLDAICFGFLLYVFYRWLSQRRPGAVGWVGVALLGAGSFLLFIVLRLISNSDATSYRLLFMYIAPMFAAGVLFASIALEPVFKRSPVLATIAKRGGAISYDVYLFHTVLLLLWSVVFVDWGFWPRFSIYLVLLVAVSQLCFSYFEKPILAARPSYSGGWPQSVEDVQPKVGPAT